MLDSYLFCDVVDGVDIVEYSEYIPLGRIDLPFSWLDFWVVKLADSSDYWQVRQTCSNQSHAKP